MNTRKDDDMTRRNFLRKAAVGAMGAGALFHLSCHSSEAESQSQARRLAQQPTPAAPAPAQAADGRSRVVIARHAGVIRDDEVQEDVLAQVVDRAVMELSGQDSAAPAWEHYFSSDEVVGVKVNGLGGPSIATSVLLTKVCVERLQGIGVRPENIIMWDSNPGFLNACGLEVGTKWGSQVLTLDGELDEVIEQGSFRGPLTAIVTKRVDGFINLPIMKDHGISGITLAMKNHYGTCANPSDHHANNCDPYIADLNTIPAIRDKQRLILCDGTRGQADGGPGFNPQFFWHPNLVMAAVDPVAHDMVGWQMIEAQRNAFGLPPLADVGRPPKHIQSAADRGLGTNNLDEIEQIEVNLA